MTPYRPRIYKRRGIWHCMGHGVVSDGYDPKHAYDEWRALVRKRQRAELATNPVAAADSAAQL